MAIHNVIIKPKTTNDQMLSTLYHDQETGIVRFMTNDLEYEEIKSYDKEFAAKTARAITYKLSRKTKPTIEYTFETWDEGKDKGHGKTDKDKKIQQLCELYWVQHPMFTSNGSGSRNKNFKIDLFDIHFLQDEKKIKFKKFKEQVSIINRVIDMSVEDRRNVAYYFGVSPMGVPDNELIMNLANFERGLCLREDNYKNFLEVWLSETDAERDYKVNTSKAIKMGIIRNDQKEGRDNYYFGQEFIGTSFNDVLAFCKREVRLYEDSILRDIATKDKENDEKLKTKNIQKEKAKTPVTPAV